MTPVNYLALGPLVLLVAFGIAAPHISALATRVPSYLTGVTTTLVAAIGGFLTQWVEQDHGYDWKRGLYNTLLAWLIGVGVQSKWLKGTKTERDLHAKGLHLGSDSGRTTLGSVLGGLCILAAIIFLFTLHWIVALAAAVIGVLLVVYV